jgi:predicted methyltransferase
MEQINALSLSHGFLRARVAPGALCIDATAGRGRDTALLCSLAGPEGRVLAMDIQKDALVSAAELLNAEGCSNAELILDSHVNMRKYAEPETVDCIVFNFGWLPGGDHDIHTKADSSVEAIRQGLELLKPGGVMSLCLYFGRNNGYEERDAILALLESLDPAEYTAIVTRFVNRRGDVAIPAVVIKQG